MKTISRIGIVAGGYVVAAIVAALAVSAHAAMTAQDSRGADGMYAFGDVLLFLFVFCIFAMVPSGLAVYFLLARKRDSAVGG